MSTRRRSRLSEAASAMGRKGGKARLRTMTAEQRSAIARKAARAKWAKRSGQQP